MAKKRQGVETGEWGFCADCGQATAVVLAPEDRLQAQLARAVAEQQVAAGIFVRNPGLRLQETLGDLRVSISIAQALAGYGFAPGEAEPAKRESARELKQRLKDIVREVFVAEQALGEFLGEPQDLLRQATEEALAAADRIPGSKDGD